MDLKTIKRVKTTRFVDGREGMSKKVGIKWDSILSWENGEEAPPPAEISRRRVSRFEG